MSNNEEIQKGSICRIDGDADSGSGGVRGGYASLLFRMCGSTTEAERAERDGRAKSFGSSEMLIQGDGRISWKRNRALKYRGEVRKCFGELVRYVMNLGNFGMRMSRVGWVRGRR
jgi:hypothetical protein